MVSATSNIPQNGIGDHLGPCISFARGWRLPDLEDELPSLAARLDPSPSVKVCLKRLSKSVQVRTVQWYRSSSSTDIHNSEIANPVMFLPLEVSGTNSNWHAL